MDEIVVVAHKDERSVRDIAANVTVISRAEIDDMLVTTAAELFQYAPGIDNESGGTRFGTEGFSIRGIGGNRVGLLVDGVPLNDQFDVGSFSNATRDFVGTGLIQRVEVLHGPGSALYGSSAIGGVIAARTPDPSDLLTDDAFASNVLATWRGSDQSVTGTGMLAFGRPGNGFLLGGSYGDGQQADSAAVADEIDLRNFETRSILAKYVVDDPLGNTLRVGLIHQASSVATDLRSMLGSGRYRSTTALRGDDRFDFDLVNVSYAFGGDESWLDNGVVRAYWETADVEQYTLDERGLARRPVSIDREFSFEQEIRGAELNLQKKLQTAGIEQRLGFGIEYRQRETVEFRDGLETDLATGASSKTLLGEVFPLRDFPISLSREWGAYVEDVVDLGDWTVIAAVRADRYELTPQSDAMYREDYPFAEPVALTDADVSPKLGIVYRITDAAEMFVQYAHGFRAPPYEDANIGLEIPVFNYRAIPNPDLGSERSDGIDVGLRWTGERWRASATLFRTRYADFIESRVRLGTDPASGRTLFQAQNLSEAVIDGFEASFGIDLDGALRNFSLDAAVYRASGENRDNGQALNSVGPGQAVAALLWRAPDGKRQLRLQATLTEAWDDRDESAGVLFKPPGHAVVDLYFAQSIGRNAALRFGLLNLADKAYWHWADVRGLSPDDPLIPHLARAGRSASLSINMSWQ
ncbi:MAG: TonB-dependent receptor [Gammaproteobacteria bacterium]|nr:TonB-dependent receptor [Gammaproteobacteria bacterium]